MYEPAMNVLWEDLYCSHFVPLIKSMPADLVKEIEGGPQGDHNISSLTVSFNRQPLAHEWNMFLKHAHRVRIFEIGSGIPTVVCREGVSYEYFVDSDTTYKIVHHITHHLRLQQPRKAVFPNLKKLIWWSVSNNALLPCGAWLAGDNLKELEFTGFEPAVTRTQATELANMVQNLVVTARNLDSFEMGIARVQLAHPAVFALLCSSRLWRQITLQKLCLPLDEATFRHLSTLPFLESLVCNDFLFEDMGFLSEDRSPRSLFASLQELTIRCKDMKFLADLLQVMKPSSKIRSLRINLQNSLSARDLQSLFSAIVLCSPACQKLSLQSRAKVIPGLNDIPLSVAFTPLLSLRHMHSFELFAPLVWDAEDALVQELAQSWPNLHTLTFSPVSRSDVLAKMTVRSLGFLSRYCHKLQTVSLLFNTVALSTDIVQELHTHSIYAAGHRSTPACRLERLFVAQSHLEEGNVAYELATLLSRLFPELRGVASWTINNEDAEYRITQQLRWNKVRDAVQQMLCSSEKVEDETRRQSID